MKLKDLKTIDINAKEWFDSENGNSYFSSKVTLNYGLHNEKSIKLPFQNGYDDAYIHQSLYQVGMLFPRSYWYDKFLQKYDITNRYKIKIHNSIIKDCKKSQL